MFKMYYLFEFHLIRSKDLPPNDFELTAPNLYIITLTAQMGCTRVNAGFPCCVGDTMSQGLEISFLTQALSIYTETLWVITRSLTDPIP